VFKGKFFPTSSILDAKENPRGSYAWTSIIRARAAIVSGLRWRIGDGAKVKLWGDRWLSDPNMPNLISHCPSQMVDYTVSKIIDLITRTWNTSKIKPFLLPFEVEAIECFPLNVCETPDIITWPASPDGVFSVQFAYCLLLRDEDSVLLGSSSASQMGLLWKTVWGLPIPPLVCNFLWKACSGALPTKIALWKRKVLAKPFCEQCRNGVEDAMHALWSCSELELVWSRESWLGPILSRAFSDFMDLTYTVLTSCTKRESAIFGTLTWLIWHVRNKKRLQQSGGTLEGINQRAHERVDEFTTPLDSGPIPADPKTFTSWSPPSAWVSKGQL
jgi:hypothetical protein